MELWALCTKTSNLIKSDFGHRRSEIHGTTHGEACEWKRTQHICIRHIWPIWELLRHSVGGKNRKSAPLTRRRGGSPHPSRDRPAPIRGTKRARGRVVKSTKTDFFKAHGDFNLGLFGTFLYLGCNRNQRTTFLNTTFWWSPLPRLR